ncbi:MAG TPA: alkaline phosphatase family protein [Holophagaceae bacterium]|nr:alkaline phosphatase family protein [Holophagaceae bacterium]HJW32265.1 alkaline phosphatase family protein [Holophagaceae bacterium]
MPSRRALLRILTLLAALLLIALPAFTASAPKGPKLVVVISVDQLSAERLEALAPRFTGGLARLLKEGVHFRKAYHAHASTETGPGHSVLLTGKHPGSTGIPENEWYDPALGREVYCVEDAASAVLGAPDANGSPKNFRAHTLGEWLKAADARNRSFAVTGKDRSAILMAGHTADGVYWWNPKVGFTTSTFYAPALPAWLRAHNEDLLARLKQRTLLWEALDGKPRLIEAPGGVGQGIPFGLPKTIKAGNTDVAKASLFSPSPFFDEAILGAAEALIRQERLGHGQGLDLLALGLSGTDYVGHRYGPGGPEMEDQLLRLDLLLGRFLPRLKAIDPHVLVVLASDHACADFPERLQAEGKLPRDRAYRLDPRRAVYGPLNAHLRETFHLEADPVHPVADPRNLFLEGKVLAAAKVDPAAVARETQAWMRRQPFVLEAVTTAELAALPMDSLKGRDPESLSWKERLRLSWTPGLGGDVLSAFAPHILFIPLSFPATHGSPHDYDRHVPLIFWGAAKARNVDRPVSTVDLAPTLAGLLHLKVPEAIDGVPRTLDGR